MADDEVNGLLIEDSPSDAFLLKELVAGARPRLKWLHAETLKDGLDILRGGAIDVVLLDLSLPDARGIETVIRTHAARQEVPIVVLTGLDDEATAIQSLQEGAQDYLVKGRVDGDLLIRAILYARERKRTEEATHRLVREQAARASAEAAERSARFLADASRALSASLDYDATLSTMAHLAVPVVADCCLVDLVQGNGQIWRVGAVSMDGGSPEVWREELPELSPEGEDPIGRALRAGEVSVLTELAAPTHRALRLPERWSQVLPRSAVIVPMVAHGRSLGTMGFITWSLERRQWRESLLAQELASRAALAVDNALLYRAREHILEVVSHDLRTPLTMMMGNMALIQDFNVPPKGPLEVISRAAQQMSQLIEDLLDMTRLEHGTFSLDRKPLDLRVLLDEVVEMMRSISESRSLHLLVATPGDLPVVSADRGRLLQVLWNLVGNGFKFTPPGGRVELRAEAREREIRIEVADNGNGIPPAQIPRLFGRFWQGQPGDLRGLGLGLSIAKAIVEAHDGRIGVDSSPAGTTFFFTLPLDPAGQAP